MIIAILTYFWTPTFLLLMQYPQWIPHGFEFIAVQGDINIPLIWQFLMLELAIDGLQACSRKYSQYVKHALKCDGGACPWGVLGKQRLV